MLTIKTDKAHLVKWAGLAVAALIGLAGLKYPDHSQAIWEVATLLGGIFGLQIVKPGAA
jgi:hypothetical protein